jgi:hypothetical protein
MQITINPITKWILLILLFPFVVVARLVQIFSGSRKPEYTSTIEGDPWLYQGDRPLLIAVWAEWASIWLGTTDKVVEELQTEFAGRCEFAYVEATRAIMREHNIDVVPVLIFRAPGGAELARFPNVLEPDEARAAINRALNQ